MRRLLSLILLLCLCLTGCSEELRVERYEPDTDMLMTKYMRFIQEDHASTPIDNVDENSLQEVILAFSHFKGTIRKEWELTESSFSVENLSALYNEELISQMTTQEAINNRYDEFLKNHLSMDVLKNDDKPDLTQVAVHFDSNIRPILLVLEFNSEGVLKNAEIW